MISSILISMVSAQSSAVSVTTAPVSMPSGMPGMPTVPTIPQACLAALEKEFKPIEAACGSAVPTAITQIQQLTSQFDKICAKTCIDGINGAIAKASAAPECASVPDLKSITGMITLGTSIACIKTADDKGYCLAEQLKLFPQLTQSADPTSILGTQLSNTELVCTDCFQKQIKAVASSGVIPGDFAPVITQLDANLAETCKPSGGIKVLAGTGTSTTTTPKSNAMAMTGMGAFIAAAALVL